MIEDFIPLLISRDQKHLLLTPSFSLRDRGHSFLPCVLFSIDDHARKRVCMCVCVCARYFFLFSENSVIPSLLLHKQNEIRFPWDLNFLRLIYPAIRSRSFVDSSIISLPFSSVYIALTSYIFISPFLFAPFVRWRFIRSYLLVYAR